MHPDLDPIDRKILSILQVDGKITNAQLSKEVGLSPAPTLERVKKLEQKGFILSYHAQLNRELLGYGVGVFVQASLIGSSKDVFESFVKRVNKIDEVVECHHVTGTSDFVMKIMTKDIPTYNELILDKLIELEEIGNIQSSVILRTLKEDATIKLS